MNLQKYSFSWNIKKNMPTNPLVAVPIKGLITACGKVSPKP